MICLRISETVLLMVDRVLAIQLVNLIHAVMVIGAHAYPPVLWRATTATVLLMECLL